AGEARVRMKYASIDAFNAAQNKRDRLICDKLRQEIDRGLPQAESRLWHGHPVWFLDGNPIVGYSKLKDCVRLMFWSGDDFGEPKLKPGTGKFKDASIRYTNVAQIDTDDLRRWLKKSETIQWDYKNVVRRKGRLERIGDA
ncbi:MAG: DUF1801 domain-containing protein, partial [Woeseiaceae bacterium]|nr:DUF1801 domain-containing protein [Woeseiaceae bacterium]